MGVVRMSARLGLGRKIGYGIGDFGLGLLFLTASQFLLYFYTDVLGLSPSVAGWVFGAAVVWDAVIDPVMGALANRARSKWGRYRPFLLFAAVPLALAWALIFLPTGLSGWPLIAFALGAHLIFRTVYTIAAMPYLALSAAMTEDSHERSGLAAFRLVFQAFAGVLAAFATLQLAAALGGGQTGWFFVALIYGAAATTMMLLVFFVAREVSFGEGLKVRPSFGQMVRVLRANSAFWLVCGAFLIGSVGFVFFNKSLPYWIKYGLGINNFGPFLGVLAMGITLSIPLWAMLTRKASKRTAFLAGSVLSIVACIALWFAPETRSAWMPLVMLLGVGNGGVILSSWAMMPDTVEYGEFKTGTRGEGAVFGFVSFVQKASLGLAAGALGEVLARIGYQANVEQTPETLQSMKAIMLGVPALFYVGAAVFILFYPLDAKTHGRLVQVLRHRRSRTLPVAG
jgi:glycoside/pentoside/hexuronide:cation symporter, GPH family